VRVIDPATGKRIKVNTTVGRCLISEVLPEGLSFSLVNKALDKKALTALIDACYRKHRNKATVLLADRLRSLGYEYATKSGSSICMDHMVIPDAKKVLLGEAQDEVQRVIDQYQEGLITDGERYNKIVDIWAGVADKVTSEMMQVIGKEKVKDPETGTESVEPSFNPIYMMADSGARGSTQQIRQLAAMRGLMAKPSGEIIEQPITANFREGLSVLQYFISTHGARKGLADTALKTANSGYLTRRLVDVAQDAVITEFDCGTLDGIRVTKLEDAGEVIQPLGDRILGRVTLEDVIDPLTGEVLVAANTELDEALVTRIEEAGIEEVVIRSVLTCVTRRGVCAKCYGRDLARGYKVNIGEAIGIIASQSIGEPGTQLTMRTFHIGGAAARGKIEQSSLEARSEGHVHSQREHRDQEGRHRERHEPPRRGRHRRRLGPRARAPPPRVRRGPQGQGGRQGEARPAPRGVGRVRHADPHRGRGVVKFGDIVEGVTMVERLDEVTGLSRKVIIESRAADLRPRISIKHKDTGETLKLPNSTLEARYLLPVGANIVVQDGDIIEPARSSRRSRARPRRRRTSRAVCRAWPSSSRPASPRTTPSSPRSTARSPSARTRRASARSHHARSPTTARSSWRSGARVPDPQGQARAGAAG
jgi:DNA-directed RNA polymerase subunit beta'